tara:strand:+ start:2773 stop:3078 length:306 start_codon:yes stop_codon:yes gene_type:complete
LSDLTPKADPAAQVFAWIVEGCRQDDIEDALALYYPDLKKRQVTKLIKEARHTIAELAAAGPDKAWCLAAYQEVYRRAIESGELGVAVRAITHIQKFRPPR